MYKGLKIYENICKCFQALETLAKIMKPLQITFALPKLQYTALGRIQCYKHSKGARFVKLSWHNKVCKAFMA